MLKTNLQYFIPHHALSRLMGKLANCRWRWFKNLFISSFIKIFHVDMSNAAEPDPKKYANFNDFFTRAILLETRPIVSREKEIACPVDGYVSQVGQIIDGKIFQAKNFNYNLLQLLGGSMEMAALFKEGNFATLYLAPKNYHRVHIPLSGRLQKMIYVPGKLFSVNPSTVAHVPDLFARNERVITLFETAAGPMAVILVGAMIVASIETVWAGEIAPGRTKNIQQWDYQQPISLQKGEELGRFKMGSTVIVLFAQNRVAWAPEIQSEEEIQLGQLLGNML